MNRVVMTFTTEIGDELKHYYGKTSKRNTPQKISLSSNFDLFIGQISYSWFLMCVVLKETKKDIASSKYIPPLITVIHPHKISSSNL